MAFMDKLGDLAKNIGEKTSDAFETTKYSAKIALEKNAVKDELEQIGKFYYDLYAQGGEVAPEVLELCQKAKEHFEMIAQYEEEKERIKADNAPAPKQCPICGINLAPDAKFCPACGEKLD